MKLKKKISILVSILLTASIMGGCSSTENKKSESNTNQDNVINERIEKNELVAAIAAEPAAGFDTTISGHGAMNRVFFSTLFKRDKELGMENDLATEYKISEDGLTWTVKLRDDVKFTDGEALTSEDVVYTYETTKKSASEVDLTMLEEIKAIDEYTIEFRLNSPQSTFIEKLSSVGIVPKHAHNEEFKNSPIGTGPYEFVQWDKGQQVIAKVNEDYHGNKPQIEKLTLVFLEDDAAYAAVKSGDIDLAQIPGTFANEEVEGKQIIELDSIETYGIEYPMQKPGNETEKGYPIGNAVTSDKAIRESLNYAIDRNGLVEGILEGYGEVSTTGLEKMPWLNEETIITEDGDIDKAKKILKDGGWEDSNNNGTVDKDGIEAEFKLLYTDGKYRQELALAYAETAKQLGINVTLQAETFDTIEPIIHSEPVLFGWGSGDPSELYYLYGSKMAGQGVPWNNAGFYKNETVDKYFEDALNAKTEEEALQYWKKAQWDGTTGYSNKGDITYNWLVNAGHVFIADENLDLGQPVVQPHGGRILDNVNEWNWK